MKRTEIVELVDLNGLSTEQQSLLFSRIPEILAAFATSEDAVWKEFGETGSTLRFGHSSQEERAQLEAKLLARPDMLTRYLRLWGIPQIPETIVPEPVLPITMETSFEMLSGEQRALLANRVEVVAKRIMTRDTALVEQAIQDSVVRDGRREFDNLAGSVANRPDLFARVMERVSLEECCDVLRRHNIGINIGKPAVAWPLPPRTKEAHRAFCARYGFDCKD